MKEDLHKLKKKKGRITLTKLLVAAQIILFYIIEAALSPIPPLVASINIILPIVGFILILRSSDFYFDTYRYLTGPRFVLLVASPFLVLFLSGGGVQVDGSSYPLEIAVGIFLLAIIFATIFFVSTRASSYKVVLTAVVFIYFGMFFYYNAVIWDCILDNSTTKNYIVTVIDKKFDSRRSPTGDILVTPWGTSKNNILVKVNRYKVSNIVAGDKVIIKVNKGFFDITRYTVDTSISKELEELNEK